MDNLANKWGTCLALSLERGSRNRPEKTGGQSDGGLQTLKGIVSRALNGAFEVIMPTICGSHANLHAVVLETDGNFDGVMTGNGSYVSGTTGGLHNWSTSSFAINDGPSLIMHPGSVGSKFTREHTVALPYHIPGTMSEGELMRYEDECFQELHVRLVASSLHDRPLTTLLMELVLGGCGASLSDRALLKIAALSERHGFTIILDEILTGGRDGTMLMVMNKPKAFREVVQFVTMGKIFGAGLVLASRAEILRQRNSAEPDTTSDRGSSVIFDCTILIEKWKAVEEKVHLVEARRQYVIKATRLTEADVWGPGIMIYTPLERKDGLQGLKNRFLPVLDQVPVEKIPFKKRHEDWNKYAINKAVVAGVKAWLAHRPSLTGDKGIDNATRNFIDRIGTPRRGLPDSIIKVSVQQWFSRNTPKKLVKKVAKTALTCGLINCRRKGKLRVETYIVQDRARAPWIGKEEGGNPSTGSATFDLKGLVDNNGADYVGDRVALIVRESPHLPTIVRYGKVVSCNNPVANCKAGPESWVVQYDIDYGEGTIVVVHKSALYKLLSDYRNHELEDIFVGRYNGDRVVKSNGAFNAMVSGVVVEGTAEDSTEDKFLIRYDDVEEPDEWVTSYQVLRMRSDLKRQARSVLQTKAQIDENNEPYMSV